MVELLIIIVTQHTPQFRVNDTIVNLTLNTVNGVVHELYGIIHCLSKHSQSI